VKSLFGVKSCREEPRNIWHIQKNGGENIEDYFAIMETLSYHDLSLVIQIWRTVWTLGNEHTISWYRKKH
jgi:hypothetical protein